MGFIIVLATPVFLLAIAFECWWGWRLARQGHATAQTYRFDDAINSISLGVISQLSAVFTRLLRITIYTLVFEQVALFPQPEFWHSWYGVLIALVLYDFCYYWYHRVSHEVGLFWGGHVVHHQSNHYNLSTALRQTTSGVAVGWIFYLPMAVIGVTPFVFGIVALIDLLYQFWVHTEHVGKLGWFDRWLCSPSNHRVHHAVNDVYVDRNYGGIWMVWDRLFGSFKEEDPLVPCVYGTRAPLNSWDPLWANWQVYSGLLKDSWHTSRWRDKLGVWLRHPGWRPADVAARFAQPAFALDHHLPFKPTQTRSSLQWAIGWFVLLLGVAADVLWHMDSMAWGDAAVCVLAVTAGLWGVNALLQNRITPVLCAFVQMAALSTAAGACGWEDVFNLAKPMALMLLMFVAWLPDGLADKPQTWLVRALGLSWVGDVLLLYPGLFLPGLVAFLAAQICYFKLLNMDAPVLSNRRAVVRCALAGALMYGVLFFNGLPAEMRLPVAVYVSVIALMAAQAWGRSAHLNDKGSLLTAVGATVFMLSDSLLAVDTFINPLPYAGLWVLTSYYLAQGLMVSGVLLSLRQQADALLKKPATQASQFRNA
jgi:alkylglycerol monooxygenase